MIYKKNAFLGFIFLFSFLNLNTVYAQHKLDFYSTNFEELWDDEFEYLDYNELRSSGIYNLDGDRCKDRVDYNWEDIHFYTDERGRRIMLQVAKKLDDDCDPNQTPNVGLDDDCECIRLRDTMLLKYKYRSGGIATIRQFNDASTNGDLNPFDDDAVHCNPPAIDTTETPPRIHGNYTGIYTGLIEARVRWKMVEDSWPAFWLYNGHSEIDIFEGPPSIDTLPPANNEFTSGFIHWGGDLFYTGKKGCGRRVRFERDMSENFHLFSCLWEYDPVSEDHTFTYFIDGREYWTETRFLAWQCPMDIRLNLSVAGAADLPHDSLEFEVDYLRIKKLTGTSNSHYNYVHDNIGVGLKSNIMAKSMDVGSNNALFFRTSSDKMGFRYISQLSNNYIYHTLDNLTAGGPTSNKEIGGDLVVVTHNSGENKVYYRAKNGLLRAYWYNNGSWHNADIDWGDKTGTKHPISDECGALSGNANGGLFYRGIDDKMHHFFWDPNHTDAQGNGWVHEILDHSAGGPNSLWLIDGDVEVAPNRHVYYRGANGRLQKYYPNPQGGWSHGDVDISGIDENAVNESCGSIAVADDNSVFYRGKDNKMHRMHWDPLFQPQTYPGVMANNWIHETLPYDNYNPQLVAGDIAVSSGQEVFYRGNDAELQKYSFYDGHWYHAWLDDNYGIYPTQVTGEAKGAIEIGPDGKIFFVSNNTTTPSQLATLDSYTKTLQATGGMINPNCVNQSTTMQLTDNTVTQLNEIDDSTVIDKKDKSESYSDLTISPNPSTNNFVISSPTPLEGKLIVTNMMGQTIGSFSCNEIRTLEINASTWATGIYYLSYSSENALKNGWVRKVVKN